MSKFFFFFFCNFISCSSDCERNLSTSHNLIIQTSPNKQKNPSGSLREACGARGLRIVPLRWTCFWTVLRPVRLIHWLTWQTSCWLTMCRAFIVFRASSSTSVGRVALTDRLGDWQNSYSNNHLLTFTPQKCFFPKHFWGFGLKTIKGLIFRGWPIMSQKYVWCHLSMHFKRKI